MHPTSFLADGSLANALLATGAFLVVGGGLLLWGARYFAGDVERTEQFDRLAALG